MGFFNYLVSSVWKLNSAPIKTFRSGFSSFVSFIRAFRGIKDERASSPEHRPGTQPTYARKINAKASNYRG